MHYLAHLLGIVLLPAGTISLTHGPSQHRAQPQRPHFRIKRAPISLSTPLHPGEGPLAFIEVKEIFLLVLFRLTIMILKSALALRDK